MRGRGRVSKVLQSGGGSLREGPPAPGQARPEGWLHRSSEGLFGGASWLGGESPRWFPQAGC